MHTSQLRPDQFEFELNGASSCIDQLFPNWSKHDRFGIVVQEPLGAVGASLLIQAAMAAFFRHLPKSWPQTAAPDLPGPPVAGTYPEVYAFHVGRRHGDLGVLDFWPAYKEVLVEAEPTRILHEISSRGITRLAVPEGVERDQHFFWPEYRAFLWRTEGVFAYNAGGQVVEPDMRIRSSDSAVNINSRSLLAPIEFIAPFRAAGPDPTRVVVDSYVFEGSELEDALRWCADVEVRQYEISVEERSAAKRSYEAMVSDEHLAQTFRRPEIEYALRRLVQ